MLGIQYSSIKKLRQAFPDEQSCVAYIEKIRWPNGVVSPFAPESKVYKAKDGRYICKETKKYFTALTGTFLQGTRISLKDWMEAVWWLTSNKKGISSYQLARMLEVSPKTAWFMMMRIRSAYEEAMPQEKLTGVCMADECWVGGKNKNRHFDKKVKGTQGGNNKDKTLVFGIVNDEGRLYCEVIPDRESKTLHSIIREHVDSSAHFIHDDHKGYRGINRYYTTDCVNHSAKQYLSENGFSTNKIENVWSILKRGIIGVYHVTSRKHLHYYVSEFTYRYNGLRQSIGEQFCNVFLHMNNRLTYKQLTSHVQRKTA